LSAVVRRNTMTLVKVIEVLAESPNSWEEAAQSAVQQASQTLRGISSIYVKEFEAKVENNQITSYRINGKVTFKLER
jgi:flavin-binding protein dodecin